MNGTQEKTGPRTEKVPTHYLFPGTLFVHCRPHLVTTVLGSCVAVCLWDPGLRIGGINHFLLPLWNGEGLPTPRYGNIAIAGLIQRLAGLGCAPGRLVAKVFGGASMWNSGRGLLPVGERNVLLAKRLLADSEIPVLGSDMGGSLGRKIRFHTGTGSVDLCRLRSSPAAPPEKPGGR